jgi:TldD protein
VERTPAQELSVKAADRAVSLLSAPPAPAGNFPAVFHPSIAGLLVHEALGHNMAADHVLAGQSIPDGKLGSQVAADCITEVPASPSSRGSWDPRLPPTA